MMTTRGDAHFTETTDITAATAIGINQSTQLTAQTSADVANIQPMQPNQTQAAPNTLQPAINGPLDEVRTPGAYIKQVLSKILKRVGQYPLASQALGDFSWNNLRARLVDMRPSTTLQKTFFDLERWVQHSDLHPENTVFLEGPIAADDPAPDYYYDQLVGEFGWYYSSDSMRTLHAIEFSSAIKLRDNEFEKNHQDTLAVARNRTIAMVGGAVHSYSRSLMQNNAKTSSLSTQLLWTKYFLYLDMANGLTWSGTTVDGVALANPFQEERWPLLIGGVVPTFPFLGPAPNAVGVLCKFVSFDWYVNWSVYGTVEIEYCTPRDIGTRVRVVPLSEPQQPSIVTAAQTLMYLPYPYNSSYNGRQSPVSFADTTVPAVGMFARSCPVSARISLDNSVYVQDTNIPADYFLVLYVYQPVDPPEDLALLWPGAPADAQIHRDGNLTTADYLDFADLSPQWPNIPNVLPEVHWILDRHYSQTKVYAQAWKDVVAMTHVVPIPKIVAESAVGVRSQIIGGPECAARVVLPALPYQNAIADMQAAGNRPYIAYTQMNLLGQCPGFKPAGAKWNYQTASLTYYDHNVGLGLAFGFFTWAEQDFNQRYNWQMASIPLANSLAADDCLTALQLNMGDLTIGSYFGLDPNVPLPGLVNITQQFAMRREIIGVRAGTLDGSFCERVEASYEYTFELNPYNNDGLPAIYPWYDVPLVVLTPRPWYLWNIPLWICNIYNYMKEINADPLSGERYMNPSDTEACEEIGLVAGTISAAVQKKWPSRVYDLDKYAQVMPKYWFGDGGNDGVLANFRYMPWKNDRSTAYLNAMPMMRTDCYFSYWTISLQVGRIVGLSPARAGIFIPGNPDCQRLAYPLVLHTLDWGSIQEPRYVWVGEINRRVMMALMIILQRSPLQVSYQSITRNTVDPRMLKWGLDPVPTKGKGNEGKEMAPARPPPVSVVYDDSY